MTVTESNLPFQGSSIWPLNSSDGVYNCSKGGQTHGSGEEHPDAPVPGRLVDPGKRQGHMFSRHPNPPRVVSGVGLGREPQEIETGTQADFQFCRLPVRFGAGSSQAYPRKVGGSQLQDQFPAREDQLLGSTTHVLDRPSHHDRKAGDIGSPPYEANTVAHPGVLGKGHPDSQVPSPPPTVVVKGGRRSVRPAFAPPSSRGSNLYRHIKRRLGCTFRRLYRKRWLVCAGKQASHQFSGIESGLVGPKSFRTYLPGRVVLVATDNTTVVAYINKEGGMRSGSLCALLWRLLSWCNLREICLRARHILGRLNVIADKLSRHHQVIQTEWSLHPDVFAQICLRWHLPKLDLFATRYNCKLPQFVSPVPDPKAWAVDALSLSWEDLDLYAFPPVPLLTNVLTKALSHHYRRMIIVAPGWPNMPWFWDLVEMSSQILVCLPNRPDLLTQPFNGNLHRDLQNLNLHAWLLEPKTFGNRGSLTKWQ